MIGVSIKAGYIELNREPPWLEPVRDGVSRQKVGRGRRQQFVQSCRTRSQPGQPRRRPGAGQRPGLRAPSLWSGRLLRSSRLERLKFGPHSLVEAQHPVRAGAKRVGQGERPTQRLLRGARKNTPFYLCWPHLKIFAKNSVATRSSRARTACATATQQLRFQ